MRKAQFIFIAILLTFCSNTTTLAQDESLQLSVRRTWGYAGFKGGINGHFSFSVRGPETLQRVQYLLDGDVLLELSGPPFKFKLNTNDYENGIHTLKAVGILSDGTRITSKDFTREFVPPLSVHLFRGWLPILVIPLIIIGIIDIVLKAIGMWKAARRSQTGWFICLLIFNTLCILPVIYLLTGGKKPETLSNNAGQHP